MGQDEGHLLSCVISEASGEPLWDGGSGLDGPLMQQDSSYVPKKALEYQNPENQNQYQDTLCCAKWDS